MGMKRFTPSYDADFLIGDDSVRNLYVSKRIIYRVFIWILLIVSTILLVRLAPIFTKPEYLPSDDFVRFWASGKLNLQNENPYDQQKIEQLQIEAGSMASKLSANSIMLNPPWAISLLMPFVLLKYPASRLVWLIFSTLLILLSSQLFWRIYSGIYKQRWIAMLVVFIFAPSISVLEKGQITALLLVGMAGFLYFTVLNRNDWLAGISLALISIKPQIVFLFWIALLFWVIQKRRWLIAISTSITILSLTLIAMVFNPHIIQQYLGMLQSYQISDWAVPTIGSYLRFFWLGLDKFWLQFLPTLLGGIWFIYYWLKHYESWNWVEKLPIILLVSLLTSPYFWTYDLVILIPAILLAVIWMSSDWKRWMTLFLAVIFLGLNILDLSLHMRLDDFWFIWLAPALFIWFLIVRWQYPKLQDRQYFLISNPIKYDVAK
jgi:hypothetical protein